MPRQWIPPEQYSAALPKATVFSCLMFTDGKGRLLQLKSAEEQHLERRQWVRTLEDWRPDLAPDRFEVVAAFLRARETGIPVHHEITTQA